MVGSLIKNLGGGLAPNGAYIAGRKDLVELAAERLTSPGQGKEVGPTLGINKSILQGLYMAPHVVASSLKTAIFTSFLLEKLGYRVQPRFNEKRADIVQTIEFGNEENIVKAFKVVLRLIRILFRCLGICRVTRIRLSWQQERLRWVRPLNYLVMRQSEALMLPFNKAV